MLLQPKKTKYRKMHKGRVRGIATKGNTLSFGDYGLKVLEGGWMTAQQIEAGRVAIVRTARKGAKIWIRVFPDKPITKRPAETRMGKGKGPVEGYVAVVKPGKIIYEIAGVPEEVAKEALKLAASKMPFKCKIVSREEL
ncbi:50S ribosomal protein L16 [Caldimicrobium thiodismutans]|jgi:large subunit ribosomal protein L16|uniref:Large ribosomal subunit protein uL16 n=1 Tax=Caldimicrobium thiodismutans TaxID=1653476 RepID=A0A0U5AZC0_9BACT|nr:50S ribosomal protein L16 [Caldimicrobium thiodismutans]BAU24046.1 50S ribosomal protein L16 [Caldimicrobium thiodismutans]